MILPQSKTFNILKTRLDCVNITTFTMPLAIQNNVNKSNEELQNSK